ncbi:glycerate kinase family protein [Kocuria sp.]|uniref:glycerate kinase family protein n=1 Tax=Kocuria sp. TaxID=1871328 RepID=UPI0026DEC33D|nr:glycerate kinase [Kocuria sp.]MDO5619167.1 glycerate kinase [Kocuria sp.]
MKVLIAPDSFKGTYTAVEVAAAIAAGVREAGGEAVELPIADGGEGTLTALASTTGAQLHTVTVNNPWGAPVEANFAVTPDGVGIVELAQASGITVAHDGPRDAFSADTYGTGQLMLAAVAEGARAILVSAGGSATSDGASGAIRAIQQAGGLNGVSVTVLTDVTTAFERAGVVFSPQKGADPKTVERITQRLHQQAAQLPKNPVGVARTGAAGGFSGGMWAQFDAELVSGADHVLDFVDFEGQVATADVVVVGEGKLDSQTGEGKIIDAVLDRVRRIKPNTPVVAVVGCVDPDLGDYAQNFARIFEATDAELMRQAGRQIPGL